MLEITESAAEAIRSVLAGVTPPSDASMRISSGSHDGIQWELAVGERPGPGDQAVQERGVQVLVDPDAIAVLDDKVLDARLEGGRIRFSVEQRSELGSPRASGREETYIAGAPDDPSLVDDS